jgi:hypothetical protein
LAASTDDATAVAASSGTPVPPLRSAGATNMRRFKGIYYSVFVTNSAINKHLFTLMFAIR